MDFLRAELLKSILFGKQPLYHIVDKKDGTYWRPNFSGYTNDSIDAGKYTQQELEQAGYWGGNHRVIIKPVYQEAVCA